MKKSLLLLCTALLALALAACSLPQALVKDEETDAMVTAALAAIAQDDEETFNAQFLPEALAENPTERKQTFEAVGEYYTGALLSSKSISKNIHTTSFSGGSKTTTECVYEVTTEDNTYRVVAVRIEQGDENGLYSLEITLMEDYTAATQPTGGIAGIGKFNGVQWALLGWTVLCYAFIVFTIVRCARDKIKLKPLFILVVLLQLVLYSITGPGQFRAGFTVTPLTWSHLLLYPDGARSFYVQLPLGALLYWLLRKMLIKRAQKPQLPPPLPGYPGGPAPYGYPAPQPMHPGQPPQNSPYGAPQPAPGQQTPNGPYSVPQPPPGQPTPNGPYSVPQPTLGQPTQNGPFGAPQPAPGQPAPNGPYSVPQPPPGQQTPNGPYGVPQPPAHSAPYQPVPPPGATPGGQATPQGAPGQSNSAPTQNP